MTDLTPAVTTEMEAWVHTRTCGHVPWLSRCQTGSSPAVPHPLTRVAPRPAHTHTAEPCPASGPV